ncbi:MAG TPA: HXXEE domain-containing protein [Ignavibacteria bacterium]|nr:HXXEE domain-containing protein [Ignavibacteria bacterium]
MIFLRKHWFDIGLILAVIATLVLRFSNIDFFGLQFLIWLNVISLFLHQFEEYRYPGYFPGMLNSVIFKSKMPDRYPLNTNSAMFINVFLGWMVYFLSAILYDKFILLAFVTMLISFGNFIMHTFIMNIKAKTFYNPGQFTATFLFLPVSCMFFVYIFEYNVLSTLELIIGIGLGLFINIFGLIKLIDIMKNENSEYVFEPRQLIPKKIF